MKFPPNNPCPCGSTSKFKKCCKIFLDGQTPSNALELMKSRYSAYATKNINYIISTTHFSNIDFSEDTKSWAYNITLFCENTDFRKLEILEFIDGEKEAFVTFSATLFQNKNDVSFCEKSRFLKENNRWLYVSGEFLD